MLDLPQLEMERGNLDELPPVELPAGFRIRAFRSGDEPALARVYAACGLGLESPDEVRRSLLEDPAFRPERLLVLEGEGGVAGSAAAWRVAGESEMGLLHMVGVHPEHRGRGLGAALVLATLHQTHAEGLVAQRLTTDDDRLAALRTYIELGYVPVYRHPSDPARWREVLGTLGRTELGRRARSQERWSFAQQGLWSGLIALRSLYHRLRASSRPGPAARA